MMITFQRKWVQNSYQLYRKTCLLSFLYTFLATDTFSCCDVFPVKSMVSSNSWLEQLLYIWEQTYDHYVRFEYTMSKDLLSFHSYSDVNIRKIKYHNWKFDLLISTFLMSRKWIVTIITQNWTLQRRMLDLQNRELWGGSSLMAFIQIWTGAGCTVCGTACIHVHVDFSNICMCRMWSMGTDVPVSSTILWYETVLLKSYGRT